jgi:uridine kinase
MDQKQTKLDHPIVIGIAGGTGSGKTTVTKKILKRLDTSKISLFSHDNYYKDVSEFSGEDPAQINFDHPNSLDTDLLIEHIRSIKACESVEQPIYDFTTFRRKNETLSMTPMQIIIVEGILIFHPQELRDLMDIKIFVDTDADERLIRRIQRDTIERGRSLERILGRYTKTVKPMHMRFVEPSKVWADIIIPRGGDNKVAIDLVASEINRLMNSGDSQ